MSHPDYIIVGAGSAGCVVANRLAADRSTRVTLLEAGGSDQRFWVQVPIGYGKTYFDERVNWKYQTDPEPGLNGRRNYWPRGKVLGGSSSINAMVYIRGQARDFDDWAASGNPGWAAKDVWPWFEQFEDPDDGVPAGSADLHITNPREDLHPLWKTWLQAGEQAGFPVTEDFNRGSFEGVGTYRITTKNGRRHSTARAFLRPAMKHSNLELLTEAHATRILFEKRNATGIEYHQDGQLKTLYARREVILCGGSVNSPQLLQLSGVGAADTLTEFGINVVHDNPSVGSHLQDHIGINYYYKSRVPTLNDQINTTGGKFKAGLDYLLRRRGLLSLSVNQGGGFIRSSPTQSTPNLQLYFNPVSYTEAPADKRPLMHPDKYSGFILSFQPCRPTSRGSINICSPDPFTAPTINANYLSTNEDINDVLEGCRLLREFSATPALKNITKEELHPGSSVQSDEALLEDFRNRGSTVFHPVGTCRMSDDASQSVVDSQMRVHGVEGLRVIDASVFPNLTSGNTNAPTIMLAAKAADHIVRSPTR